MKEPKGAASRTFGGATEETSAGGNPGAAKSNGTAEADPAVRRDAGALLMRHRVSEPRVPVDYCDRAELIQQCRLTARPVTLVMAPGGFGKTTLLAACCEAARTDGVPTAWLTLSSEDTPAVLDRYVAHAFEEAGIGPVVTDALASAYEGPYPRTRAALHLLEVKDRPCVLVLDELERATDPACAALLGFVLRSAPHCLRLALSCRELPAGLDAAAAIFGAEAEVVAVDDLRFSPEEISRFFDFALSRSELAAAVEETAGWPIALRMWRAERAEDGPERGRALVARDIFENWIEGRLLADFVDRERELLLDISLFDPVDAALVDDVLEQPGALDGLLRIPGLAGLITRTGSDGRAYRMHPLLRRYCERRRRRAPERYRKLQRRIAVAMGRRNKTVAAMRHAVAADDPVLGGRLLADAGAPRVWLQEGADQLLAADRLLTDAAVAGDVRLAFVRCIARAVSGDLVAARRTFASAAPGLKAAANGDGLDVEMCLVRGTLMLNGCESVGAPAVQQLMAEVQRAADQPTMPAVVRGTMEYGLCIYRGLRAEFESARQHGARARALVLERSPYVRMVVDFQCGQVAMAQGRTQEATQFYRNGGKAAKASGDGRLAAMGRVLTREMDLERNRIALDALDSGTAKQVLRGGVDFGCQAAAGDIAVRYALDTGGVDRALSVLDGIWERARATGLPAFERYLAGVRVGLLAVAGRVDDAMRTWDAASLPADDAACLDLDSQSWREMEVVSCARLRVRIARGERDAARDFARALADRAAQRGLLRTRLRALALLVVLESGCGRHDEAVRCVVEYLGLCAGSGYQGALLDTGAAGAQALQGYLDANPDGALADRVEGVLRELTAVDTAVPVFRGKQREVLERLAVQRDKDIAASLGLSEHGVRYHVRTIFQKLGIRGRSAAVRRARELGILPPK